MLLSRKLLNRYVDISDISTEKLADVLTNAGHEVEGISQLVQGTDLVVGYVESCEKHPDSDHLNITQVNIGDKTLQIVCGASNVAQGQYVVVAQNGSVLPEMTLKPTSIRGVESNGMICSLNELGVAEKFQTEEQKNGIVVLEKAECGSDPRIALGLDDDILDVSQTPNRSDFMSIFAVAREVAALFDAPLRLPEIKEHEAKDTNLKISSDTDKSQFFLGKVVNDVTIKESPAWIKEALIGSNIKPINNVVDISNLVMLETGQPMHFYDIDFLSNQTLSVSSDIEGTFEGLDAIEYQIKKGDALIMNADKPVGIAGIMGLGNSMIQDTTRGIIIEVARFDHVSVRKTASRLGLSTEASQRFSKPMDNAGAQLAMNRAIDLLVEYADAKNLEKDVQYGELDQTLKTISITTERVNSYLGTTLSDEVILSVFERLNFKPQVDNDVITCTVPSYRKDLFIEEDLIEEVIRVVGYDVLEATLPTLDLTLGNLNESQRRIRLIEKTMLGLGADQINSYTLVSKDMCEGINALDNPVKLMSPMSDKRTHLRTYLYPSMMEVLAYNNAHSRKDILFFEHSRLYQVGGTQDRLGIIASGSLFDTNWTQAEIKLDFFALKGILMNLFETLGFSAQRFDFVQEGLESSYFHPFKSAKILINKKELGYIGHIHPNQLNDNDLKDAVYAEINLDLLASLKSGSIKAQAVSKYPVVTRDLAILVDKDIKVKDLSASIQRAARKLLLNLNVFDVFTSEKLGSQQSIAFELSFGTNRTLDVAEINDIMELITNELADKYQASVR